MNEPPVKSNSYSPTVPDHPKHPSDLSWNQNHHAIQDMVYIALFTALIAVCSQICIPAPAGIPPVTLQTLAVFLAGGLLGRKCASLSVLVYLLLGTIGVPVFARFGSGVAYLIGTTGGYLIGFLFTAFFVGWICEKLGRKFWVSVVSMTVGLLFCYLFGTVWFMIVYAWHTGPIGLIETLGLCVFPFLPFDVGKIIIAALLVNRLDKRISL